MSDKQKNIILTAVLGLAVLFSWFHPLDSVAEKQIEAGFQRSVASYVVAKTLNSVISFVQGTEISFQMGVGATITPGQALDPVNDLVEQFAELMLAASVAFGIMLILVKIGSYWVFSLLLTIGVGIWLWMRWNRIATPELLTKVIVALLFVRFSMPMVTFGSDLVYKQFLEDDYKQSQSVLDQSSNDISSKSKEIEVGAADQPQIDPAAAVTPTPSAEAPGMWQKFTQKVSNGLNVVGNNAKEVLNIREKISKLKESTDQLYKHVVNIIVVFILQTIVIPIFFLWALYKLGIGFIRSVKAERA